MNIVQDSTATVIHCCDNSRVSEMFCVRCELEPNTDDKISDKREQVPEYESTENAARAGTHEHVRPEPNCVSSPDEMGISSRSRKGSVCVSLQHLPSDEVRSSIVVRHVRPTDLLHDCSNIIVNSGGLCRREGSSDGPYVLLHLDHAHRFRQHVGGVLSPVILQISNSFRRRAS